MGDVRVDRVSGRVIEVLGEPRFHLREIGAITEIGAGPSRQISYDMDHKFGLAEWHQVVGCTGDFSAIGIQLDRDVAVSPHIELI